MLLWQRRGPPRRGVSVGAAGSFRCAEAGAGIFEDFITLAPPHTFFRSVLAAQAADRDSVYDPRFTGLPRRRDVTRHQDDGSLYCLLPTSTLEECVLPNLLAL